jgi:hypothetical protein
LTFGSLGWGRSFTDLNLHGKENGTEEKQFYEEYTVEPKWHSQIFSHRMADSTNETTMLFINDPRWVKVTRVSFGTHSAGVIENMAGGVNEYSYLLGTKKPIL